MKPRDWVYVGESVPKLDPAKNTDFILHAQNAMLLSLVKRELLTATQAEQIKENIEAKAAKRKSV